jgi:endothelin-converting enzyme
MLARVALKYARNLGDTKIRRSAERLSTLLTGVKVQPNRTDCAFEKSTLKLGCPPLELTQLTSLRSCHPVCVRTTRKTLEHLAGAEFVSRAFGGSSKEKAEAMIGSLLAAFRETLGHLPWMDKESADAARRKADNVIAKVGYPLYPNTTSPVALRAYYGRQTVTDDFLANAVASSQMELQRAWQQQLGNLRNRDSWLMAADEVNAYANPPDSEIVFPAGILEPPFYSASWPSELNYGAIGAVAGELEG